MDPVAALPAHLSRHVVPQRWESYPARAHQTWRTLLGRLVDTLSGRAHPAWFDGLTRSGIGLQRIPRIEEMQARLGEVGWSAVCVRGFIPPAAFTGLLARGILPVAADIRTPEHLEYTPAPDIVHESAGHAPLLTQPLFAEYVRRCARLGASAISSAEDAAVFDAIRGLSEVSEDPRATEDARGRAREGLRAALSARTFVSEGARASRLFWWTVEYGLLGRLAAPLIVGAGLLSSLGESVAALGPSVRRLPLTPRVVDVEFDITRMQPQLFVAEDFAHLFEVLAEVERGLEGPRGGDAALREAERARTDVSLDLGAAGPVCGRVHSRWLRSSPAASGDRTALVHVAGAVAPDGGPARGDWLVALGARERLPAAGPFAVELGGGVALRGVRAKDGLAHELRAARGSAELAIPRTARLVAAERVRAVVAAPTGPVAETLAF